MDAPILSLILWSPLVFGLLLLLVPSEPVAVPRRTAFAFSLVPFFLSLVMLGQFDPSVGELQLVQSVDWMPTLGVRYSLGVDGFSIWLVLLTTLLTPVVLLASWSDIRHRTREFMVFMLVLEWGMLGALVAIDLFLFFLFWELMLFPMFFVIGIWGGERRYYATLKFVLYTMAGTALMLVAVLYLVLAHARTGTLTFDITSLYDTELSRLEQTLLFWGFAIAFMIKVPMVPLHTWLADAHTEAPTGGSVDLAGVLLKMGAYGFLRFALPMFPLAAQDAFPVIVGLSVVGIVYGAMVAFPQPDMKRLIAYSSVSHMGFIMLGIYAFNPVGLSGGVLQMVNHGISTSGLFLLVGLMHDRTHTREISYYGGIWAVAPIWSSIFLVVMLGSIGLPGTNGFVGEFLVLMGAFHAHPWAAAIATTGVVLGAAYLLTMYKHIVFGPLTNPKNERLLDVNRREVAALAPILALTLVIGIYPRFFLDRIEPTVDQLLTRLEKAGATRYVTRPGKPAELAALVPARHHR
ncbi:MAG TPA: NADH-quinone oxidoreductase subunit M [Candidatus Methylomirabilis sp.]|nr:NADH-quinone oxidoreductase subunit M [Candidatus Methylomirabilis sp.]